MYDQKQLDALGKRLGETVSGGDVIELIGDVGAGKTTFTRAIAQGMGIADDITSPTFTISNRYTAPSGLTLVHYDFYRLNDPGIIANEITETINDDTAVAVIEWAGAIEAALPEDRLSLTITAVSDTERKIVAHGDTQLREKVGL